MFGTALDDSRIGSGMETLYACDVDSRSRACGQNDQSLLTSHFSRPQSALEADSVQAYSAERVREALERALA